MQSKNESKNTSFLVFACSGVFILARKERERIHFFEGRKRSIFESNYSSRTRFDFAFGLHIQVGTG